MRGVPQRSPDRPEPSPVWLPERERDSELAPEPELFGAVSAAEVLWPRAGREAPTVSTASWRLASPRRRALVAAGLLTAAALWALVANRGVELSVTSDPSGAEVRIGGKLAGRTPLSDRITCPQGHTLRITVHQPDHATWEWIGLCPDSRFTIRADLVRDTGTDTGTGSMGVTTRK